MLKVLLVEDEELIRRGLRFQMDWTAVGCAVAGEAGSGAEGLQQIETLRPDVVITDIRMPDMDGLEMLERGCAICPFDAIIISGHSDFDYARQAIHLKVTEYLLKPVDLEALRQCLLRLCSQRREDALLPMGSTRLPGETKVSNPYAAAMLQYIRDHYVQRISLTDLSQELNLSCTYLNAKFKAETGSTFHDFLNHYRISRAVELQQTGRYKLYEIAEMVGFSDYKYFNKVFKKYVGYSPNKIFPQKE